MKTILRILLILNVAALIGGAAYLLLNSGTVSSAGFPEGSSLGESGRQIPDAGGFTPGEFQEGMGRGGERHGEGMEGGAFSWGETVKNFVIIAILVIVVALVEGVIKRARRRKAVPVIVNSGEPEGK